MAAVRPRPAWLSQLGGLRRTPHHEYHDECYYSARDISGFRGDLLREARAAGYLRGRHPHWVYVREQLIRCPDACQNTLHNIESMAPTIEDRQFVDPRVGNKPRSVHFSLEDTRRIAAQQLRMALRHLVALVTQPVQNVELVASVQAEANRLQTELESLMKKQKQALKSPAKKNVIHVSSKQATPKASPRKDKIIIHSPHSMASPKRAKSALSIGTGSNKGSPFKKSPRRSPFKSPGGRTHLVAPPSSRPARTNKGPIAKLDFASPKQAKSENSGNARVVGKASPRRLHLDAAKTTKCKASPLKDRNAAPLEPTQMKKKQYANLAEPINGDPNSQEEGWVTSWI